MNKLIIIIVFPIALIGCAVQNIPNDYVLQEKSSEGVAVVSLTMSGECAVAVRIHFGAKDGGLIRLYMSEKDMLDWGQWCENFSAWSGTFPEGSSQAEIGRLFAIEFAEGNHEFIFDQAPTDPTRPSRLSIPFSVFAGKVTYIGNIHIKFERIEDESTAAMNVFQFGMLGLAGSRSVVIRSLRVRDMRERDLGLLFEKYPKLQREQLVVKLLKEINAVRCNPAYANC